MTRFRSIRATYAGKGCPGSQGELHRVSSIKVALSERNWRTRTGGNTHSRSLIEGACKEIRIIPLHL